MKRKPPTTLGVLVQSVGSVVEINRTKRLVTIELSEHASVIAYELGDVVELQHDKALPLEAFSL